MNKTLLILSLALLSFSATAETVVEITDDVIHEQVSPFGINLWGCGEKWSAHMPKLKNRVQENFEGSIYRNIVRATGFDVNGFEGTITRNAEEYIKRYTGSRCMILSGPDRWQTRTVVRIDPTEGKNGRFTLDKPYRPHPDENGFMLDVEALHEGHSEFINVNQEGLSLHSGDVANNSFGQSCLSVESGAGFSFPMYNPSAGVLKGNWTVRFRAKKKSGSPAIVIAAVTDGSDAASFSVKPGSAWKTFEKKLTVPSMQQGLVFAFTNSGGVALMDDLMIRREGDTNPTDFRDDVVNTLKRLRPSVIRHQYMGGSGVENTLRDRLHAYASSYLTEPGHWPGSIWYGMHQIFELCEEVGANPWYTLPGTTTQEEMKKYIEYLAAPPDTGWGAKRAAMGHPKPWSETFDRIHIEIGNEYFTFGGAGYSGPDYWNDLIETGKASPYCATNMLFYVNSWTRGSTLYPAADRRAFCGYIMTFMNREITDQYMDTDDKLFRWALAFPYVAIKSKLCMMGRDFHHWEDRGGAIYEANFHPTRGDTPAGVRNKVVASMGSALTLINYFLLTTKRYGVEPILYYDLDSRGAKKIKDGKGLGRVKVFSCAISLKEGEERYRPSYHAMAMVNAIMRGRMYGTRHGGDNPTIALKATFDKKMRKVTDSGDVPLLYSYAFGDDRQKGLVLINTDIKEPQTAILRFDGIPVDKKAALTVLEADSILADNEFETGAQQVLPRSMIIDSFESGHKLELPPHSIITLEWSNR